MQRVIVLRRRRFQRRRFYISTNLINRVLKITIVFLCVYISAKCLNIISGDKAKEATAEISKSATNLIAREIVENSGVMTQYMLYLENHKTISEKAKKKMLTGIVEDYISQSEYTYDTTDPGYEQVINLIYEKVHATDKEEKIAVATNTKLTAKTDKKVSAKAARGKKELVPIPKVTGTIYSLQNLQTFQNTIDKFYTITSATTVNAKDMPIKTALKEKFRIKGNGKEPQILIYHTHSQEEFCNSTSNPDTTVIGVGNRLKKVLTEQFGYNVIHDVTTYDIVNGKLDRNEAYDQARVGVKKILEKYPSISLVLDIHRDGVNENTHLVTDINGKKTAQIMFFNGMSRFKESGDIDYLYNPYLFENLALSLQMKVKAEAFYPGFTRRNYINAYKYNLDLCRQCMLIEVGAQTNTYQEAQNAAEPLAVLLNMVLGE